MRDNEWLFRGRFGRFHEELVAPNVYPHRMPLQVSAWKVPDEPVPFEVAVAQQYEPFQIGTEWGLAWSTIWLHVTGTVPGEWLDGRSIEILMDLGFRAQMEGGQAEGLAFRPDGTIIKAIEPFNRYLPVEDPEHGVIDFYLEAAANPEVGIGGSWHPTPYSSKATVPDTPLYVLRQMDVAVRDDDVWELDQDMQLLRELVDELPPDLPRRAGLVAGLNRAIDAVDPHDVAGTAAAARAVLAPILAKPAYASAHHLVATGHAHIDSAWLWPIRETVRKCARTFANVIALMDDEPDMVFSCSSAQQYSWIKQYYPELWERLKEKVAAGQFVPVGGMWVESDTNMPGSEALARQFVQGKKFFMDEFGIEPLEVWLPDSFGYSGALPQIARAAGSRWFFTQKMSWSEVNQMPHHTFLWEGIDGTRIFTHFPPVDTYNSRLAAFELAKAERQYKEQGHGTMSLVPFGYGDGGGGPTREMVARARRTADLEGSPTVRLGAPEQFFREAEAELERPSTWTGEMYLENHRGTYTSQLPTKQGNRRSEHALRAAELWATTAAVRTGAAYPYDDIEGCWQTVLLQQFHDILPGSSIAWVHREAEVNYGRVLADLDAVVSQSLAALTGEGDVELLVNSAPRTLQGVAPMSVSTSPAPDGGVPVVLSRDATSGLVLDNGVVRVVIDADGHLSSVLDLRANRELIPPGRVGGLLQLHNDRPSMYEAWDIDAHITRRTDDVVHAERVEIVQESDDEVTVEVARSFRSSSVVQRITLARGSAVLRFTLDVDWHESRTLLKLSFPTDVLADRAASESAFGYVYRTTHTNTSWDLAQHETCAHRWVHVGEPGFGVAVANDSTYGHDITRQQYGEDGPVGTTIRLSLVRGPQFPDPDADQGRHHLAVSLVVGADISDAVLEGQHLNQPVRRVRGAAAVAPLLSSSSEGVVVEAVKLAEDRSGDVVVRLYESLGRRTSTTIDTSFDAAEVVRTDLLERRVDGDLDVSGHSTTLHLRPFEIVTLRFTGVREV